MDNQPGRVARQQPPTDFIDLVVFSVEGGICLYLIVFVAVSYASGVITPPLGLNPWLGAGLSVAAVAAGWLAMARVKARR